MYNNYQKMNFSPFPSPFGGLTGNAVNQFATAKFAPGLTSANGQVVSVVSNPDGGLHYVRPVDHSQQFAGQLTPSNGGSIGEQAIITVPITMPSSKPGEAQQTVHIQLMNPNAMQQAPGKFQMGQMQIPLQGFQPNPSTVLTVAYQDGKFVSNGLPEGMTVLAALQPQDLHLIAQAQVVNNQHSNQTQQQQHHQQPPPQQQHQEQQSLTDHTESEDDRAESSDSIAVKQEPSDWDNSSVSQSQPEYTEYMSSLPFNLQPFLKFNPGTVKFEPEITISSPKDPASTVAVKNEQPETGSKQKRKRKPKKKQPKEKVPKPGQVMIATAIDGTTLFCCPECHMAYPEKENLEQHLTEHKIERRYICDICGAGLKRKEHLERHKSGHNPDRPYICSVCLKGFKRKEHLNLHFVIHSGEKNEICGECGKGFYRKDHLRKHANSHIAKRIKEEMTARSVGVIQGTSTNLSNQMNNNNSLEPQTQHQPNSEPLQTNCDNNIKNCIQNVHTNTQAAISISTVYVPTSDNTTVPVQIQIPQIVTTSCPDGLTSTLIVPSQNTTQTQATS